MIVTVIELVAFSNRPYAMAEPKDEHAKLVPDEGSEGSGTEAHVALDPEEADEQSCDPLHQPQVVELFGVLGVDLLQTERGQSADFIRTPLL